MRDAIFDLISNDNALIVLGIGFDSLYSGDVDTPIQRPYGVLRWGDTSPGLAQVNERTLTVWIHDNPGDYRKIDDILARLRVLLEGISAYKTTRGWIAEIRWLTDSGDLSDDTTRTIARTSTYAIVASG
jgi:hypothetical protein